MKIREARKKDRKDIIKIASDTWEGWDYVPQLLDEWFAEGGLLVAVDKGKVIGITKTTVLSYGELWLEGIRVKKQLRGKGIGKELALFQLGKALEYKPRVIRLSTAEINTESIKLIEKLGFRKMKEFTYMQLDNLKPKKFYSDIIKAEDRDKILSFITVSNLLDYYKGLFPWSWIFREVTPEFVSFLIDREQVFVRGQKSIISLIVLTPHRYDKKTLEIGLIYGSKKEMASLFEFTKDYAVKNNFEKITLFSPSKRVENAAKEVGFVYPYRFKKVPVYELVSG